MPQTDPTSRAILRLGAPLSARYTVVRLLGIGSRAVVYEGLRLDGRPVTIKVFARELSGDPDVARELRQAIRRAGDVAHPSIVHAVDEGEASDGAIFIVTPLLRGQTLRDRADRAGGALPITEVISIADGALRGLAAAHAKGLVHGDLKPTNVFLTSDAAVRILDFGLGLAAPETITTPRPGAHSDRAFVAPECRATNAPCSDPRADVWGLGATLFFAFTGRLPSELEGADGAPTLATVAGVPSGIGEVVDRSLARDPASRWADAAAMREALLSECAAASDAHGPVRALTPPLIGREPSEASGGVERSSVDGRIGTRFEPLDTEEPEHPPSRRDGASEVTESRVGTLLGGKYRLEQLLGEGGTAAVYRAAHRNGHRVAVKVLHPRIAIEPRIRDRFLREGYVVNRIDHPGVVRVSDDCVLPDGTAFLVMELLEGESLDEHVGRSGGVLSPAEVVSLSLQILDVLSAAHAAGVVHRDIKPGNLFVTSDGTLRVLDFGIARVHEPEPMSRTRTGAVMGTPAFMAPEQALGQTGEVDARTDIWAVGATMVRLLTGEYVHAAPTAEAMRVYAGSRPARSLRTIAPGIDAALGAVVDKALASDKAARWPSAAAMREALASLVSSGGNLRVSNELAPPPEESDVSTEAVVAGSRRAVTAKRSRQPLWALALTGVLFGAGALLAARWRPASATADPTASFTSASARAAPAPVVAGVAAPGETDASVTFPPSLVDLVPGDPRVHLAPRATARPPRHPMPSSARTTAAAAPISESPDPCTPPYVTDSMGRRTYKPQCLPESPVAPVTRPVAAHPCDPPYVVDSMGRHLYKSECLNNQ